MKRTKPTKSDMQQLKPPHGSFPGYMPDPPAECDKRRTYEENGVKYIDNVFCANCKNKCQRRKEFDNEWKQYWAKRRQILGKYENSDSGQDMVD